MNTSKKVTFQPEIPKVTPEFLTKCPRRLELAKDNPLYLEQFPSEACPCALKKIMSLERGKKLFEDKPIQDLKGVKSCQWYIIDEDAHYCYLQWAANPINQRIYTLDAIALLFGTSCINIWLSEQKALERIEKAFMKLFADDSKYTK